MNILDLVPRPAAAPPRDQLGEGPFWSEAEGLLYWVDIAGRWAHRIDPATGQGRSWRTPSSCSAIIPSRRGSPVVALVDGLHRLDPQTGATTPFARPDPDGGNRSNDTRCDPQGRIWLGTMDNNLGPEGEPAPLTRASGGVFCVEPDGRSTRMLGEVGITNSLAWSPDGARFYCADTTRDVIWSFAYDPDGPRLSDRRVFFEGGPGHPDGSSMDEDGCLWNARWGAGRLVRLTPDGRIDRELLLPVEQPSSCAFGGADRKTLFITTARQELEGLAPDALDGSVFAVAVDVAGMPLTPFAG
ncbi:MAG TPA: SMP-30/gluconolactonase/LRE family protein [Caulobacteraceae bacterium]|nr:SMP-30/gluconolactonase/LRE family protein [Caulobacteraceae bacterium]